MTKKESLHVLSEDASKTQPGFSASTFFAKLSNAGVELLWPTRCALCNRPGFLLCPDCRQALLFYDPYTACPRCGAPFGRLQCCACNSFVLHESEDEPLYCSSSVLFDEVSASLIRCYKDAGEQRLCKVLAAFLAQTLNPTAATHVDALVYVPSSKEARARRGFDHMEQTARELASMLHMPVANLLEAPGSLDQRGLSRKERIANMHHIFRLKGNWSADALPPSVLLVDDVFTTGATLNEAAFVLREAGVRKIIGHTFARVV